MKAEAGRDVSTPRKMPLRAWKQVLKRTVLTFFTDRVMLFSAGVTLYLLIALVPALSMIVSIYGLFSDPVSISEQVSLLRGIVPEGGLDLIRSQLVRITSKSGDALGWTLILASGVALWSASLGIKGLFEAMNIAYGEREKRNFIHVNALALLFTLGAAVIAAAALATVILLPAVLAILPQRGFAEIVLSVASFLILAGVLLVGLAALYRWGPSRNDAKWRWITPGAMFSILAIMIISIPFSWYVTNFGNYSATYGSLGAVIGFLTWLWFSVIAVVVGAKLNAEIEHQTAKDTTISPDMPMGQRGAYVADTLGD